MYPWIKSQAKYILIYLSRGKERKQTSNIFAKENEPVLLIPDIHKRLTPSVEKESVLNICSAVPHLKGSPVEKTSPNTLYIQLQPLSV